MSRLARFSATDVAVLPGVQPARQFRLVCEHGETVLTHVFGPAPSDEDALALLRARLEAAERCGCAASVTTEEARA
jgi:hypothetical protein